MANTRDTARMTIENCEMIARKIVAKFGGSMQDAMSLAEFNLKHAVSVSDVIARIEGGRESKPTVTAIKAGVKIEFDGRVFTTVSVRNGVCKVKTETGFIASIPLSEAMADIENGKAKLVA